MMIKSDSPLVLIDDGDGGDGDGEGKKKKGRERKGRRGRWWLLHIAPV
jgi:hypothetical protein